LSDQQSPAENLEKGPVVLAAVAGGTGGNDVVSRVLSASNQCDDVIDLEIVKALKAVGAPMVVVLEDRVPLGFGETTIGSVTFDGSPLPLSFPVREWVGSVSFSLLSAVLFGVFGSRNSLAFNVKSGDRRVLPLLADFVTPLLCVLRVGRPVLSLTLLFVGRVPLTLLGVHGITVLLSVLALPLSMIGTVRFEVLLSAFLDAGGDLRTNPPLVLLVPSASVGTPGVRILLRQGSTRRSLGDPKGRLVGMIYYGQIKPALETGTVLDDPDALFGLFGVLKLA
jgi:hypothetical protein